MIKKSDLYASIWSSCDELRGGMDASQYKDYVLTLLFMKYVSDKYAGQKDAVIVIPEGGAFADMVKVKGDVEIGDKINKIIGRLAEANDLRGVIDVADFNDEDKLGRGKEMQDRLSKLVAIFEGLDFRLNRAEGDDLLGDAYEYLMRHFATESGKSKGQFYTPAEVSRIMAKVVGMSGATRRDQTIYDPTCGSGSLLLKAADEAPRGITIYGQENDNATWALAKMNMILHGHPEGDLWRGNTLANPYFKNDKGGLKTFDFAVANPPFSTKAWTTGFNPSSDQFHRFDFGVPPTKNGDYAFLLHVIASLKSTGKAAVILPHGVLFRGNREAEIRKNLLQRGLIKGIIGLPPNLFYGTGIPACLVVVDKAEAQMREGVFMIDASRGFMKDGPKNRLRSQDIHKIVDVFTKQTEIPRYSRMVALPEIGDSTNDYNLNIPRYVDSSGPEDIQDLHAHLHGGIPDRDIEALRPYWEAFPNLRDRLFSPNRSGYWDLKADPSDVQGIVSDSEDFKQFAARARSTFVDWFEIHRLRLESISPETRPNELVAELGDDLLTRFQDVPLVDPYDIYEQFLSYWHETMHDDVFLIMTEGWVEGARPRKALENKNRKLAETPDLTVVTGKASARYKMDLLPPNVLVTRYFANQGSRCEELDSAAAAATRALEEFGEEQGGEDGSLSGALDDDGKLVKKLAASRLKEAKAEATDAEEVEALQHLLRLYADEAAEKTAANEERRALSAKTLKKYGELGIDEIKGLVIDGKWRPILELRIANEANLQMLVIVQRIQELGDRYSQTMSALDVELEELESIVSGHLADMGITA
jgi:type I restriction enzyme M protein